MATSPSHRFGQIIGDLLEEIMAPQLQSFCDRRGLYLDKKGDRGAARDGKKVTWQDKFGNSHDLDFVIEKGGSEQERGRPLAFIEAAWRRYTKHSRNKAQEIQGAVLPIAERYRWDSPFLGAVLAGVFTDGSLQQMKSSGFEVVLFPYETIVAAFSAVGIRADFDEDTADAVFEDTVRQIESLDDRHRAALRSRLVQSNKVVLDHFFVQLEAKLDRKIERISVVALHGAEAEFSTIEDAIGFISDYDESIGDGGPFRKYEVIVKYSNADRIDAAFSEKRAAIDFLSYIVNV